MYHGPTALYLCVTRRFVEFPAVDKEIWVVEFGLLAFSWKDAKDAGGMRRHVSPLWVVEERKLQNVDRISKQMEKNPPMGKCRNWRPLTVTNGQKRMKRI